MLLTYKCIWFMLWVFAGTVSVSRSQLHEHQQDDEAHKYSYPALELFLRQALPFSNSEKSREIYNPLIEELMSMADARNQLQQLLSAGLEEAQTRSGFTSATKSNYLDNLTLKCGNQTLHLLNSAADQEMWAMKMLDAWGKPPAGFLTGMLNWIGDYEECVGLKSTYDKDKDDPAVLVYDGVYCTGVHPSIVVADNKSMPVVYQQGMCIPSGCNNDDAVALYNFFVKFVNPNNLESNTVTCQPRPGNREWSSMAKFTYALYGLMALLCITSGLYDYAIHGTIMYYKVHRLPIPLSVMSSRRVQTNPSHHRLSADDEGNLIQNDQLGDDGEENAADSKPSIYKPDSSMESASLVAKRIWLTFSCYSNGYKVLTPLQPSGSINCLHGIRFLSLAWVILGHCLIFSLTSIATPAVVLSWIDKPSFQAILNATVSVDSFFLLSGLLTCYLAMKDFTRRDIGVKDFFLSLPIMYLHRYLRLTPALGFMLLFYMHGIYNLSGGPLWPTTEIVDVHCQNNSWAVMFYVNNLYQPGAECAAWSWFLSNDFQFFIIAPFVVALLYRFSTVGMVVNVVLVLISCISAMVLSYKYKLQIALVSKDQSGSIADFLSNHWFADYYVAPWCRYQSYGIGIIFGYLIWKTDGKLHIHWLLNLSLWFISAALCLLPLYGPFEVESGNRKLTVAESVMYNSLGRVSWCLGLGYIIFACHSSRGGWVNEFLSWKGFIPVSRLTFCAYLIHPVVMTVVTMSHQYLVRYTYTVYASAFVGFMLLTYCAAFSFSLLFESPFLNLDKLLITGALKKRQE